MQRNSLAHSRHSNIYSLSGSYEKISKSAESQINYDEAEGKVDFCVSPNIGSSWVTHCLILNGSKEDGISHEQWDIHCSCIPPHPTTVADDVKDWNF